MKVLSIDVTAAKLVVAAFDGNKTSFKISQESGKKHNALVMPYIEEVLNELNLSVRDIDVFSCVIGPGSFTGIRIGIATMKALSFAMKKPCVAINALEEMAYGKEGNFHTAIDALHDNYYTATFNGSWDKMSDVDCKFIDDIKKDNLPIYFKESEAIPQNLIDITLYKANKGEFSILEPLYLRKSQAERDRDGD